MKGLVNRVRKDSRFQKNLTYVPINWRVSINDMQIRGIHATEKAKRSVLCIMRAQQKLCNVTMRFICLHFQDKINIMRVITFGMSNDF